MQTAALTLKYNDAVYFKMPDKGNSLRKAHYKTWVRNCRALGGSPYDLKAEYDPKGVLHYHGRVDFPKSWTYDQFRLKMRMEHMHVYIDGIYKPEGWDEYINKDQKKTPIPDDPVIPIPVVQRDPTPLEKQKIIEECVALLQPIPKDLLEF